MSGLRVLVTADAVGGVWQYSLDLARGLAAQKVELVLALLGPAPSLDQRKAAAKIPSLKLVQTKLPLDWMAEKSREVREAGEAIALIAAKEDAGLVQLNAPALAAEAEFGVPVLAVSHSCLSTWWQAVKCGRPDGDFRWRAALHGLGLRAADRAVAPSAAFARATADAHGLRRVPDVVHNGRTPLRLPKAAPHDFAFAVGRLWDKSKNAATLDRAAARLAVPLHAAGPLEGPNGDSVLLAHANPLGSLCEAEIARRLAARPVFVSAALYEPFGLAALEAAQAGCPLVLSDIPTHRELWDGAAVFVEPTDAEGFAAAISDIIGDDYARARLGGAARERARRYGVDAMAARMAALYRELAGAASRPAAKREAA